MSDLTLSINKDSIAAEAARQEGKPIPLTAEGRANSEAAQARLDTKARFELMIASTKLDRVRGDLSPSLMPDALNNFGRDIVDLETDGPAIVAFDTARGALKELYQSLADIADAHASLLKPIQVGVSSETKQPIMSLQIPPERSAEFEAAINNRNARLTHVSKRAADVIDQSIAQLDNAIAAKLRPPRADHAATIQEAAEIRAYIKSLPPEKRTGFLMQACDSNDLVVVAAVLSVRPWAAGITPEQHAKIREFAQQSFAPRETRHAAALRKMKNHFLLATGVYAEEVAKRRPVVPATPGATALARLKGAK